MRIVKSTHLPLILAEKTLCRKNNAGQRSAKFCKCIKISFTRLLKLLDQQFHLFQSNLNFANGFSMQMQNLFQNMLKLLPNSFFNKISSCDPFFIKPYYYIQYEVMKFLSNIIQTLSCRHECFIIYFSKNVDVWKKN